MAFVVKTVAELPFRFLNSSLCSISQTNEEDTNYFSSVNLTAFFLTVCTGLYLAQACWKKRGVKKMTLQDCVNDPSNLSQLQKAASGSCKVYLGQDFVIKQAGDKCNFRATRTQLASKAIQNNAYTHLIVPKVFGLIRDEYLAEERLPVHPSIKDAATIYETYRDAFTPAVKEFTNLLIRCSFTDVIANGEGPVRFKTPVPRYDNVCPYLEKGEGKLGLIDLEHFEEYAFWFFANEEFGTEIKYCNTNTCKTLIHLFPLHFEEIIRVMQEAGLQLSAEDLQILRSARDNQLEQRRSDGIAILSSAEEYAS